MLLFFCTDSSPSPLKNASVCEVDQRSVAELSGICQGDRIVSIRAGNDKMDISDARKANSILSKACSQHTAVVVFIRRAGMPISEV